MEQAINITRKEELRFLPSRGRVYLGNDFCPRLLPLNDEFDEMIAVCLKKKLKITIVTSYAGSDDFGRITEFIGHADKRGILSEAVVNDIGVLNFVYKKFPSCRLILGRALASFINHQSFREKYKIERIEADSNAIPAIIPSGVNISVYGVRYAVVTRYCAFSGAGKNFSKNPGIIGCCQECLKFPVLKVEHHVLPGAASLRGNVVFFDSRDLSFAGKKPDRLVNIPRFAKNNNPG